MIHWSPNHPLGWGFCESSFAMSVVGSRVCDVPASVSGHSWGSFFFGDAGAPSVWSEAKEEPPVCWQVDCDDVDSTLRPRWEDGLGVRHSPSRSDAGRPCRRHETHRLGTGRAVLCPRWGLEPRDRYGVQSPETLGWYEVCYDL